LGQSVLEAVRLVRGIHKDVCTMITSLDAHMNEKGWYPTEKSRVTNELWHGLDRDVWLITAVYRIYKPHPDSAETQKVAAIVVDFDPPQGYAEPVCLLLAARFPKPRKCKNIWDEWDAYANGQVLSFLSVSGKDGVQKLEKQRLNDRLLPGADAGSAFVVPLCDINGEVDLESKVVRPLLGAVNEL